MADVTPAAAEATAPKVDEPSEFIVGVPGVPDVGAYLPHRVTYGRDDSWSRCVG